MPTTCQSLEAISRTAVRRLDELAALTDSPGIISRSLLSKANFRAAATILDWWNSFGLETAHTPDGSVRGILPGSNPSAKPLLIGSHFDSVIDAGKFDGPLGIVSALAALEFLAQENITLPFPVHLLGFSDEEGVRFQTTYLGSRSIVGTLDPGTLSATDESGQSLAHTLATEGWHSGATPICYQKGETRGYLELHIEQGRVLQDLGQPACAVSTIVGQSRFRISLHGQADHAGTTPMPLRRDALAGAAACIVKAEAIAESDPDAVLTVGKLTLQPGASNVIAGETTFSLDLRHPDDSEREKIKAQTLQAFEEIASQRDLGIDWQCLLDSNATPCDSDLTTPILDAVQSQTGQRLLLPSGAGHDGVALAPIMPIAMIFVRCRDGISHHPKEHATSADIQTGIKILADTLQNLTT
ncbi:MAG: M20 family metallo-hydrolase [Verrucomicrobiota bacterium]